MVPEHAIEQLAFALSTLRFAAASATRVPEAADHKELSCPQEKI